MNLFFLISLFAFLSCSQIQPISEVEVHQDDSKQFEALFSENIPEGVIPIRSFQVEKQNIVRKKVIEKYPVKKTSQKGLGFDKKYEKHELFKWWVKYFTGRDKERFQRVINRSLRYEKLVKSTLRSEGLPEDLFYLAFIESGFVVGAKSRPVLLESGNLWPEREPNMVCILTIISTKEMIPCVQQKLRQST